MKLPSWNVAAELFIPNFAGAFSRLARLEVDLEFTGKLLDLQAAYVANDGRWPEPVTTSEPSNICPRDHWIYRVGPQGASIALDRELTWPERRGPLLSTRFLLE